MDVGDKLMFKSYGQFVSLEAFRERFKIGSYYRIDEFYEFYDKPLVSINGLWFNRNKVEGEDKYLWYYFYTPSEVRLLKLNKLKSET
jgi:hypothetical protein